MAVYKCKMCGDQLNVSDDMLVCECASCGTVQSVDAPRSAGAGGKSSASALMRRMKMCLEDGDFAAAGRCADKVLDTQPENAQAYLGKLLAAYGCRRLDDLNCADIAFYIDSNYKRAVQFGTPGLKKELERVWQNAKARDQEIRDLEQAREIERQQAARAEENYRRAKRLYDTCMNSRDLEQACALFKSCGDYLDAQSLAETCGRRLQKSQHGKTAKNILWFIVAVFFLIMVSLVFFGVIGACCLM